MLIIISLLFADNVEEADGEVLFNCEVQLFSAMALFSEVESALEEVLISLFAVSLESEISFLAEEDNSAEEESDTWLKSSFVF